MAVGEEFQERFTEVLEFALTDKPVGAGGVEVGGCVSTLKFQFAVLLLSQLLPPLLKTIAIVVALPGTV
jgi:hypothetical protein